MAKTEIELQISRGHGPSGPRWGVRISDRRSGAMIVDFNMSDEKMGTALGSSMVRVKADVFTPTNLGRYRHTFRDQVPIPDDLIFSDYDPEKFREIATEWVRDQHPDEDWKPNVEKQWNSHRLVTDHEAGTRTYTVWFHRFTSEPPDDYEERIGDGSLLEDTLKALANIRSGRYESTPGAEQELWDQVQELIGWE